jgi:hypothetical protein
MRFTPGNSPRLAFFPQDGKSWRIDWFGDVAFPNKRESHRQPSICIAISRLTKDHFGQFISNSSVRSQRQIWAPVGLLPNFRIGDIWQDGFLLQHEADSQAVFENLVINRASSRVVKAGVDVEGRRFLLSVQAHPWHMNHTHSYCLVVKLSQKRQLIIPCVELIRFYFGSSSSLLATLFTPPLDRTRLYSNANYHHASGRLHFKLAPGISGYSASDVGRLHCDLHAWRAASEIGASLLRGSTRKEKAYPSMHFPFAGSTTLVVNGEWLPLGELPDQSFLIHSIQSCSYPFPFRTLAYDMPRISTLEDHRRSLQRITPPPPASQFSKITGAPSVVAQDPSKRYSERTWHTWQGVKFPDLETKNVFKKTPLINRNQDPFTRHRHASAVNTLAVAEPTGTQRPARPLELAAPQQIKAFDAAPEFLRNHLSTLISIPDLSITLMTESHLDGWSVAINAMQEDNRSSDSRLYLKDADTLRIRLASVVHITAGKQPLGLLVLLEHKTTQGYWLNDLQAKDNDVAQALETAAIKFLTERTSPAETTIRRIAKLQNQMPNS